jgi:outer membrane protein assembly factor BamB
MPATHHLTRRRLLTGGALAGSGALTVQLVAGPRPVFEPWEPPPGTWPVARRGPRRTAATLAADPPIDAPSVAWTIETDGGPAVVADTETAYVGGEFCVAAVALSDGTVRWQRTDVTGQLLAVRDGVLFCVSHNGRELVALDVDANETIWTVGVDAGDNMYDLLPIGESLLVGRHGWLEARDVQTGEPRWRTDVGGLGDVYPAVVDGRLYAGGPGPLETYEPRTGWATVMADGPKQVALGRGPVFGSYPTVDERHVYVGGFGFEDGTHLYAFGRDGTTRHWTGPSGRTLSSPAVADGIGVVRLYVDREPSPEFRVIGVDLRDGSVRWRRPWATDLTEPVVMGDLALVAVPTGTVRAIRPEIGDVAWSLSLPGPVDTVVPAGDRILLAGRSGTIRALR